MLSSVFLASLHLFDCLLAHCEYPNVSEICLTFFIAQIFFFNVYLLLTFFAVLDIYRRVLFEFIFYEIDELLHRDLIDKLLLPDWIAEYQRWSKNLQMVKFI